MMDAALLGGRYRLDHIVGSGVMAVVYQAFDTVLERTVAIKLLQPRLAGDSTIVESIYSEARAVAKIEDPNVVAIHDIGEHEGRPYLVLEFIAGGSLRSLVRARGPLSDVEAIHHAAAIAHALRIAHEAGIIHRDVKSANVLVAEDGTPKLGDFGLARIEHDAHEPPPGDDIVVGSMPYAAPRLMTGSPATPSSDLFALGVVCYEMLTATLPEGDAPAWAIALSRIGPDAEPILLPPDGHEPKLVALVNSLLDFDPAGRPPGARAVEEQFLALLPAGEESPAAGS